jgi:23S rRNA (cytidine2498-2'-O)-methyltransferase
MNDVLLLYCRPGFEQECAEDVADRAASCGVMGKAEAARGSGFVLFTAADQKQIDALQRQLRFDDLSFARQMIFVVRFVEALPAIDRLGPLRDAVSESKLRFSSLFVEHADSEQGRRLSSFCRKFAPLFEAAALEAGLFASQAQQRLHLFFPDSSSCYLGFSRVDNASAWPLGIARIKSSAGAPSRSALKLGEAFATFLSPQEQSVRLRAGMHAVDLGAAPGGWSWQLAYRGLHVAAVDNGPLSKELIATGLVEHLRADGFRYRPERTVDWMVCDMVEKPSRVAALVAQWISGRWCRHCIFNLKLPMKKRYQELQKCAALISSNLDAAGIAYRLRFRQLYHDREEVTGYLYATAGARRKPQRVTTKRAASAQQ